MEKYRTKIERHSAVLEKSGFSPVASRIYIFLLFAPDSEATFDQLVQYFTVSKSAISNGLKFLTNVNLVMSITKSGKRKRYFKVDLQGNTGSEQAIARLNRMKVMCLDIYKSKGTKDKNNDLYKLIRYYDMMLVEYPAILEKWRRLVK